MLNAGQLLQNRYRIDVALGQGGMGAVYRAFDLRLQCVCVVKELLMHSDTAQRSADAVAQFWQEAQTLSQISHPGLPRVTDYFEEGGSYCLVMDFINGQRLDALIGAGLPEAAVLNYADQLLDVLEYIHGRGILHRDIKPQNIIVQSDGRPVLVDFGLVKNVSAGGSRTKTIIQGMGTLEYAPPEQYGGGTDQRSDLYALGATLFHALTGQVPPSVTAQMSGVQMPAVRKLKGAVSPNTERVILTALNLDRNNRYPDAASMRAALRGQAPAKPTTRLSPPAARISPLIVVLAAVIVIMLAASIVLLGIAFSRPAATPTTSSDSSIQAETPAAKSTATRGSGAKQANPPGSVANPVTSDTPQPPAEKEPTPITLPTTPAPRTVTPAPPSPDQAGRLVFARGAPDCSLLVVRNLDTGAETTFTADSDGSDPSWSPDGNQFTAALGRCNAQDHAIAVFSLQTRATTLAVSGGNNIDPFWGSDGRIYFVKGQKTGGDLYSVDPGGGDLTRLGFTGRQPALSPDGQILGFMALDGKVWRIWIARSNGSGGFGKALLVPFPQDVPNGLHARMTNWASDNRHVIFNVTDSSFNSVALGSVDVDTNQVTTSYLTTSGGILARPACSHIGPTCVANGADHGLYLVTENQGGFVTPKQITDGQDWGADIYP